MTELDFKRKATEFLKKGRYEDAIAQYQELIEKSKKKNPAILNLIGDIYVKQASYDQAFEAFLEAIRLYAEEELFHNGIAIGKKILRLDKDQIEVYGILGNLYARQGLGIDSMKFLKAYAQHKEEADEYPVALAAFAEACEILNDTAEIHIEYGAMLERVGRTEDAHACYRNAAQIYTEKGQDEQAAQWLQKIGSGGASAPAESETHDVNELMSLRTLDDDAPRSKVEPKSESREQFWGRKDEPDGLTLESADSAPTASAAEQEAPAAEDGKMPWIVYDPGANPALPPPPPLPTAAGKPPAPAADAAPVAEETPVADPNEMFVEPGGLGEEIEEPAAAAPAPPRGGLGDGLELELDLEGPTDSFMPAPTETSRPPAPDEVPPLESLPGIVLPGSAPAAEANVPEPPAAEPVAEEPVAEKPAPAPTAPETTPAPEPVAEAPQVPDPSESADADLAAFFESAQSAPEETDQQAVVIGDDFELLREGGDVSEVIADFREATMEILELDDFQAHYDLGTTYMEMELFDEAAAEFEVASRGEAWALASQEMLGYCFLRKGQIDLAIKELQRGLEIPGYEERDRLGLLYNLGIARGVLDQEEEAIANFQRILEVDPNFRDTRMRLERLVQSG